MRWAGDVAAEHARVCDEQGALRRDMFTALARVQDGLRTRYAEPHRAYHTQAHVDSMLTGLREVSGLLACPDAVELAIWFHDAIYDPAASDNEIRSAELLLHELQGLADPALLHRAALLIRATESHSIPPDLPADLARDLPVFLDLDMAVLGAEFAAYDAYERGIATEYVPVHGETKYRAGRAAFVKAMLARPRLFLTEAAHNRLDEAARANLARAITR